MESKPQRLFRDVVRAHSRAGNFAIEHEYLLVVAGFIALIGIIIRFVRESRPAVRCGEQRDECSTRCLQVKILYRSTMSGVFVCCRPCVRVCVRRRIRKEHNDKVRQKAFEKQQQLERERQRKEEEDAVAARVDKERTKHLVAPAARQNVALPAHMIPDVRARVGVLMVPAAARHGPQTRCSLHSAHVSTSNVYGFTVRCPIRRR